MAYEINYEDQKFKDVETAKDNAISDLDKTYGDIVDKSDDFYKAQVDAATDWEKKQTELQNQQTDFAINEIEQKKEQAQKDYTKEQSGAYADWKKQSNPTGVRAEQMADQGMQNTGYSESSQVSMFNTYQNRVTSARESYQRIVLDFDNSITQARLQNNSALAEIAYKSLQQRLELNLQGFQYKNDLLLEQASKKTELEKMYHERWQDVLKQMNTENELAEQVRQFDKSYELQKRSFTNYSRGGGRSSGGGGYSGGYSGGVYTPTKTSGSGGDKLNSDTAKSILALGQGPISASNLASQVASGKVTQSTNSSGNTVFKSSGSAALSGAKPIASSSSKSSSGGVVSKVVNAIKNLF